MKIIVLVLLFNSFVFGQKCLLWNKLQNNNIRSIIGPNGTVNGTVIFGAVKFNNGARATALGNGWISVDTTLLFPSVNKGCAEFWVKPTVAKASVADVNWLVWFRAGADNNNRIGLGMSSTGIIFHIIQGGSVYTITDVATSWGANERLHVAFVWDKDAGFDGLKTMAIYVNNVQSTNGASAFNFSVDLSSGSLLGFFNSENSKEILVDNIKAWNYAKTDFSDRHKEAFRQTGHYH